MIVLFHAFWCARCTCQPFFSNGLSGRSLGLVLTNNKASWFYGRPEAFLYPKNTGSPERLTTEISWSSLSLPQHLQGGSFRNTRRTPKATFDRMADLERGVGASEKKSPPGLERRKKTPKATTGSHHCIYIYIEYIYIWFNIVNMFIVIIYPQKNTCKQALPSL